MDEKRRVAILSPPKNCRPEYLESVANDLKRQLAKADMDDVRIIVIPEGFNLQWGTIPLDG